MVGIIDDIQILGHNTYTKGVHIEKSKINEFRHIHIHKCLVGVHIEDAGSDYNTFEDLDIGDCDHASGIGIDLDAGNEQLFKNVLFHHNTMNVDDEVGDSSWINIQGELDVAILPTLWASVAVATHAAADTWTAVPVEVRAAATSTKPFKIVATLIEADAAEKFRVRFSHDSAVSWFDEIMIEGEANKTKREAAVSPPSTDHIFNVGTQIVAAAMSESGGNNTVVWLEIQEI